MKEFVDLLKRLTNAFGPSGFEDEVREIVIEELKPLVNKVAVDQWGNVIGIKEGRKKDVTVMVAAHMDEIGFMINYIEKKGFLRFLPIGGWNPQIIPGSRVIVRARDGRKYYGVIGMKPPHIMKPEEAQKVPDIQQLFIDVGASSAEEVKKLGIDVGCVAVLAADFQLLGNGDMAVAKAFDDRVGVAVMIEALRMLKNVDTEATIYAVATVKEEVGLKGAQVAAYRLAPKVAIAIDVTLASDVPGVPEHQHVTRLGAGPAIKVMDGRAGSGLITHPKVLELLRRAAEEEKIPYQLEVLPGGTTDATAIAQTREGVPAGGIAVPTRYVHSGVEVISLKDAYNAAKLTAAALKRITEEFVKEVSFRYL